MRSHAKAPFAGSTLGRGGRRPSVIARKAPLALAFVAFVLLALAPLSQARVVVDGFGTSGSEGGQFDTPRGAAVNNSGVGATQGTVYVVDSQNRVQRFSPSGAFERLWGFDVVTGGGTDFEICTVASECQAGAEFPTTANGGQLRAPWGVAVDQADGHVYVTERGNRRVSEFDADGNFVRAWGNDVTTGGTTDFEICTVASECKQGEVGSFGGEFGETIGYPVVDSAGNVFIPDSGNRRIQVFDSSGNFVKAAGGDVITNGATGTGTLETTSKTITNLVTTSKYFEVGQTVTSSAGSIPPGTTVTAVSPTTLTLSDFPTANGSETITAAPGSGNSGTNEKQTLRVSDIGEAVGKFNLIFDGERTGGVGTADWEPGTTVLTNVDTTAGAFAVGQIVKIGGSDAPPGTTITAIDTVAKTLTVSTVSGIFSTQKGVAVTGFDIPLDISAAGLQAKLATLSNIAPGDVSVSGPDGGPWTVEFQGPRYGGADVPPIHDSPNSEPGSITGTSSNGLEVCSVAAECRKAAAGTAPGQFGQATFFLQEGPESVALDATGSVYALDPPSGRVQKFAPDLTAVTNPDFGGAAIDGFTSAPPRGATSTGTGTRLALSIQGFAGAEVIELGADDSSVKDRSLAGAGLGAIEGMAERNDTGTLYLTTDSNVSPKKVLALDTPIASPVPVMSPVATKGATTATFSGTVNPVGGIGVSCKFEYSTDSTQWTEVPEPACPSLAPGGGAQAVSEGASGLLPNQQYFVRLSVTRLLDPSSTTVSGTQTFSTDHVSPEATLLGAIQPTDTSLRFVGEINPMHSATEYVFQYGTTPALGSSTLEVGIGDGAKAEILTQVVTGLEPNTIYYFRLVATNLAGTATTQTKTARTRSIPLPASDSRSYEQVTPVDKNGGSALLGGGAVSSVAGDGEAVRFVTSSLFGDPSGVQTLLGAPYVSRRSPTGWQTKSARPPTCGADLDDTWGFELGELPSLYSLNLDKLAFTTAESESCAVSPLVPGATLPAANLYLTDLAAASPTYKLLTPAGSTGIPIFKSPSGAPTSGDADFSHVVYTSEGKQTPDTPQVFFEPPEFQPSVFDWDDDAQVLRLVSRDTNNVPFESGSSTPGGAYPPQSNRSNITSSDGSRIFFQTPARYIQGCSEVLTCRLYMREDGTTTHYVSEPECTSSCSGPVGGLFTSASLDGSKVIFRSGGKLADEDTSNGMDLYMYTHGSSPTTEQNLSLISRDEESLDGSSSGFLGVVGTDRELDSTIFFAATGQLVAGDSTLPGPKVYRWHSCVSGSSIEYLTTLDFKDGLMWEAASYGGTLRVTPDGEYLVLDTVRRLEPAADQDEDVDVYRWDEDLGWICASCQDPGTPSVGNAVGPESERSGGGYRITEDGRRIFFATPDSLLPEDLNEGIRDVYEWHDGRVSLISSGTDNSNVRLIGSSADGVDVFFDTEEPLVGWDVDETGDIYDARIGGGFPEPPPTGAPCEGEACRGASTVPPQAAGAGSAVFEGPGNTPSAVRCRKGTRKVTVRGRTVCKPRKQRSGKKRRGQRRQKATANRGAVR